jgi:hypothetical protein
LRQGAELAHAAGDMVAFWKRLALARAHDTLARAFV